MKKKLPTLKAQYRYVFNPDFSIKRVSRKSVLVSRNGVLRQLSLGQVFEEYPSIIPKVREINERGK